MTGYLNVLELSLSSQKDSYPFINKSPTPVWISSIYLCIHTHTHTHTHIFTNLQCAMYYTWLSKYKEHDRVGHRVAQTVILATQEVEIRRIEVRSQPGQIVCKNLSQKTLHKNRAGGVAQWLKVKALSSSPSTTHTHTLTQNMIKLDSGISQCS
jgi:hypothetical protein